MTSILQQQFNAISDKYDRQRRFLIPCFDDFYAVPQDLSESVKGVENILDIGAGTGLMSAFFHQKYPEANITLIDVSEEMLKKAKDRFEGEENTSYQLLDFTEANFETEAYDLVISGLAIHHLEHADKQQLFKKIYKALKPGGMFINADQVEGTTPEIDAIYKGAWVNKVEASTGLSRAEKDVAYKRVQLDIMAPLDDQLNWLKVAGFKEVSNYYQYYNFVVFAGKK